MHLTSLLAATGVLTSAVLAAPTHQQVLGLELDQLPLSHPDFDLDLNARRLVQFSEYEEPVWVTELEKARMPSSPIDGALSYSGRFKPRRKVASSLICKSDHSTVIRKSY
jgi:hypothetical protein